MFGHELAVEEAEPADLEPRYQPGEGDLGGIAPEREHAFTEKGRTELHPVEAADEDIVLPAFDRMGMTEPVELVVGMLDLGVDPGFGSFRALPHHSRERFVAGDGEDARAHRLAQRAG